MRTHGFTLVEVLLSLSCLVLIVGMVAPAYVQIQNRNDIDTTGSVLVQSYRKAQLQSQSLYGDSAWGVYVATGSILIYKGSSYASRDVTQDENTSIPSPITISGLREVVFAKVSGLPSSVGTTTFTSTNNETRSVYINQKGMLDY